ncbi:MAG: hypothetical protein IPM39_03530 [Chloroflexi bacterium]|nr:hypothetical protein [Chloroflexota bacterium]
MMADSRIPDTTQLADWLDGKLSPEETAVLSQHIQANPNLQEQADWLHDFLQISRTTTLINPPPTVRQAATAAFAAYAQAKRPSSRLQNLIATLTADNWQRLSLAGVRNITLGTTPRQLIYSSDLADVALNIQAQTDGGQIDLNGQLFPLDDSDPGDFIVQLLQDGLERRLDSCNDLGKFSLTGLPAGVYELLLSSGQMEIEIGPLELR